jgi:hypothetical protein
MSVFGGGFDDGVGADFVATVNRQNPEHGGTLARLFGRR